MDAHHSAVVIANIGAEIGRRRITQKKLGEMVGMSPAAISERQRGQTKWSIDELGAVADALGVPLAALVTDPRAVVPFQPSSLGAAPIAQLAELRTFNPDDAFWGWAA